MILEICGFLDFRTLYSSACSLAFSLVLVQRRLSGPGSREVGPSPGGFFFVPMDE